MLLVALMTAPAAASGRPVSLAASDGTLLSGTLYEASLRPAPAVLLVHMLGRSKEDWAQFADRLQAAGITALAVDLRGHGRSSGAGGDLSSMVADVTGAFTWLAAHPGVQPGAVAIVGASLGANLAALAAADRSTVRAVALVSPSLDYRGVRVDTATMKKIGDRPVWLAASTEDPYALRTIKELAENALTREQRLTNIRGHGSTLLAADPDLARALVDWLKQRLIF